MCACIHTGCLGLGGQQTCDNRDIKKLDEDYIYCKSFDTQTPHKLFDVHNLFFGLMCLGVPLSILGVKLFAWYSPTNSANPCLTFFLWVVAVVVMFLFPWGLTVTSAMVMFDGYKTLDVLQNVNSTLAMEVCSPLPLFSALVTSTVYLGVFTIIGFCFVAAVAFIIITYGTWKTNYHDNIVDKLLGRA